MPYAIPMAVVGMRFGQYIIDGDLLGGRTPFMLASICDQDQGRLAQAVTKYGVPGHADIEPILRDPGITAVCLITPPAGRADLLRRCIRAGKHVMTTKPFEVDPDAAAAVLEEARSAGIAVHLNSPGPVIPGWIRKVHRWVDRHRLGRPSLIEWHSHASYREAADGSWYDSPAACPLAPIFRLGIYALNDIHCLIDDEPEAVTVMSSRFRTGRPTPDVAQMSVRYRSGCIASLSCTFACESANYPDTMAIHYERGAVYRGQAPNLGGREADRLRVVGGGHSTPIVMESTCIRGGHAYDWKSLADAMQGVALPHAVTPERIVRSIRVVRAMARAEASGRCEPV